MAKFDTSKMPDYHILISMIEIWTPADKKKPNGERKGGTKYICEVESVEIEESFKKLIGTASVRFPRGTIIRQTVTPNDTDYDNAEVTASLELSGVINETRQGTYVANVDNFSLGDRIKIYLGYTRDPEIAELAKTNNTSKQNVYNSEDTRNKYLEEFRYVGGEGGYSERRGSAKKYMSLMFDGYITKISLDTPIQLECENLASALKEVTCSKKTLKKCAVKNFLGTDQGSLNLLENTGLKLHSHTAAMNFDLGNVNLTNDLTVADVLTEWAKYGLFCYVADDDGQPAIKIGRAYYTDPSPKDSLLLSDADSARKPVEIHFDYHVANNGLTLMSMDPEFLALEAQGIDKDDKFYHITIIKNKDYDNSKAESDSNARYRYVNETKLSKKALKAGKRYVTHSPNDKVDLKLYTKISFISKTIPVTKEKLIEEAIKYLEGYNCNGIEGSLTLFGDLRLRTAQQVELIDDRYPGKNGLYLVEEVNTTFGTDGFRQKITLPYCIKRKGNGAKKTSD